MLRNYVLSALRNIRKSKLSSAIAVFGFSIGIAAALFIFLYARYELSFDKFLPGHERIHRLVVKATTFKGAQLVTTNLPQEIKLALLSQDRGIEAFTQASEATAVVGYGGKTFEEESDILATDSSFFKVFGYPLLYGDAATVLEAPLSAVISRAAERKYFGDENPIGKTLSYKDRYLGGNTYYFTVTGVLADLPPNSTFRFDFVLNAPFERFKADSVEYYNRVYDAYVTTDSISLQCHNYVKLKSSGLLPALRRGLAEALERTPAASARYIYKKYVMTTEALDDIHLFSSAPSPAEKSGDFPMLLLLAGLGILVILIACVNVINLSTARAMTRMKETGIRKTLGATRRELVSQFLVESVVLCLISLWFAAAIVELLLPSFNSLFGTALSLRYFADPAYLLALLGIALLVGLLSGLYPAIYLSSNGVTGILKGQKTPKSGRFREAMVVLQFAISIGLFISSSVILREFRAVKDTDLGFDPSNLAMIRLDVPDVERRLPDMKRRLESLPGVLGATATSLAAWKYGQVIENYEISVGFRTANCDVMVVDPDYVKVSKIALAAGSDFDDDATSSEDGRLLVDETAAKRLGLKVGSYVPAQPLRGRVVGIVKDFDYRIPSKGRNPLIMTARSPFLVNSSFAPAPVHYAFLLVRLAPDARERALQAIEDAWKELNPGYAFERSLVDRELSLQLDEANRSLESILFLSTILAFAISGLGLFGLATYELERRTKEVGIRKALGATSLQVVGHFLFGFLRLAAIANLIAWPLTFALIRSIFALVQYPHPLVIGPAVFLEAASISFAITALTVGAQTLRAAAANPVIALRYE